eukprot:5379858-Amphidinium_carterae.1
MVSSRVLSVLVCTTARILEHKIGVMHHGDDFVAVGPRRTTPKVGDALSTVFIVKDRGVLRPRSGDLKQIRVLNRTLTWREDPTRDRVHSRQTSRDSTADAARFHTKQQVTEFTWSSSTS